MRLPIAAALLLAARCALAQPLSPPPPPPMEPIRAIRASAPIVIDGTLDEAVWRTGPAVGDLLQSDPRQGAPASQRSEIRVAYDDDAIYVGARMWDTHPDSIVARLSRRDSDGGSDVFLVMLDTFRDKRTGYYFGLTAADGKMDGSLMNDDWDDDAWDGVWTGHTHRDSLGWTAEMRIPFSQMRCRGGDHMVWGVNFKRTLSRAHEENRLVYTPRGQSGFVSRFPEMVGLDGIHTRHTVDLAPYGTLKAEDLVHRPGDPWLTNTRWTPSAGGDLRTNLGTRFTLNATVNPDFGQVEIDPAVVNLSDAETYYDEKRPFFTEGLSVFRCGNNGASDYWNFNWPDPMFFYTRRIGRTPRGFAPDTAAYVDAPLATHILGALKTTGQLANGTNVGLLQAVTREERARYQLDDGTRHDLAVEPLTSYTVLRGIRSFHHERQGLGLMAMETARALDGTGLADLMNRNGLVTAVDGWTALDPRKDWVLSGEAALSRIDGTAARITALQRDPVHYYQRPDRSDLGVDPNATSLEGGMARLWLNRQRGPWMSNSAFGVISPGFEPNDLGFGSRADIVNGHVGVGYMWDKPNAWRKYFWMIGAVAQGWNFAGQHTMNQLFLKANLEQMNAWSWVASGGYFTSTPNDRRTRGGPAMRDPAGWWSDLYWDTNGRSKLFLSAEVNPSGDDAGSLEVPFSPSVTWKPSTRVSLSGGPTFDWNRSDAQYVTQRTDPLAAATYGGRYVFAQLDQTTMGAQFRIDCSLTPNLSLQVFVQPLVSSGRYSNYRELARPDTYEFLRYGRDGGSTLVGGDDVVVDPDGAGPAPSLDLGHPDFTFRSVRGDAVLRWEYVPGSTFYLVWTQDRANVIGDGRFSLSPSLSALSRTPANNIVMAKVSHHFTI